MGKYNQKFVSEICAWVSEHGLIDYGGAKLGTFLQAFGIDDKTYYRWMGKDEFKHAINAAKDKFKSTLAQDLAKSLAEVAKGYEYTKKKKHKEYRPNADGSQGRLSKLVEDEEKGYCPPNVGAAIFLLTNLDPEHYQNRQKSDIQIKKDDDAKEMTMDEINAEIARLQQLNQE